MQHNYESDLIRVNLYLQKMYQKILNQKIEESRKEIDEAEVIAAKTLLAECVNELREKSIPVPEQLPQLGIMVETPAAVLEIDTLAKIAIFCQSEQMI